ncbi:MAG: hypothetical protein R3A48_21680 [Polyangiales bacterium]
MQQPPFSPFGPPAGTYGPRWSPPSGPAFEIAPEGSGGFSLKYVALAGYLGGLGGVATLAFAISQGRRHDPAFMAAFGLLLASGAVTLLSAMLWIYKSWEFLPQAYRRNASGREFSPLSAAALHFVPLYNLYWIFVQNLGYCDAIDSVMIQSGRAARSPRTTATAACILQLVPYLNYVAAPVAWLLYMFQMDRAKSELRRPRAG